MIATILGILAIGQTSRWERFYQSLLARPTEQLGISAYLTVKPTNNDPSASFVLTLKNQSKNDIWVENFIALCFTARIWLFDSQHNIVKYPDWSAAGSYLKPWQLDQLSLLQPKGELDSEDFGPRIGHLPPGSYVAIGTFKGGDGISRSPLKVEYWKGAVRTEPVEFQIVLSPTHLPTIHDSRSPHPENEANPADNFTPSSSLNNRR